MPINYREKGLFSQKTKKTFWEITTALGILSGSYFGFPAGMNVALETASFIQKSDPQKARVYLLGAVGSIALAVIAASQSTENPTQRQIRQTLNGIKNDGSHFFTPPTKEAPAKSNARQEILYLQFEDGKRISPN